VRELLMTQSRRIGEVLLASDLDPAPILEDIRDLADQTRVPIVEVTRGKLDTVARSEAPQGVIARADQLKNHTLDELLTPQDGRAPFLLVLDHVTDPGNLGAILRTAECAGVTGVVLPKHRAARISPSVTKAAAGAIEHLRIGQVGGVARTLLELTKAEVWTIGLDASGATLLHDLQVPDGPIALVLGAEQSGLSRLVAERCDLLTRIPIVGNTESLNVSAAAAIATYHLANTR
jgi:23S rRNA (guanosine2251-2'-O)-methyltransferase